MSFWSFALCFSLQLLLKTGAQVTLEEGQNELSFADLRKAYHHSRLHEVSVFLVRTHQVCKCV